MDPNNAPPPAPPQMLNIGFDPVAQQKLGQVMQGIGNTFGGGVDPNSPEYRQALIQGLQQQASQPMPGYGAANAVGDVLNAWGKQQQGPAPDANSWMPVVTKG